MCDQRMTKMENKLVSYTILCSLLNNKFDEHKYFLTTIMVKWDTHRVQPTQFWEMVIYIDSWKEHRIPHMETHLNKEMALKEDTLTNIQDIFKGNNEARPPSMIFIVVGTSLGP